MRAERVSNAWWRLAQGNLEWTRLVRDDEGVIFDKTRSGSVVAVKRLRPSRTGPALLEGGSLFIGEVSNQASKATADDL